MAVVVELDGDAAGIVRPGASWSEIQKLAGTFGNHNAVRLCNSLQAIGRVLLRLRKTEIHEDAVTKVLRDISVVFANRPHVPVLLLLEDAHWSDQTTQSLVERLLKRIEREHALVLISYRPELKTNWSEHSQTTLITCKPIGYEHCATLIRQVDSRAQIDESLIREIVTRSDGVPLFAEELTKAVLDLRSLDPAAVPLTLQGSLMARLDRLGRAKDIAQIASVIGRQFSHRLLKAIAGASDSDLRTSLARLRESGLIFEAGNDDQSSSYSFNHSLVQEAAYENLSRSRRQLLHKEIASHLESGSTATDESEPTLIAHHYGRAGEAEKSFHFWLLAADRSSQRLAFADSIASLSSALVEADRVADAKLRARLKVDAQLKLATTLVIHKGPQSSEAESALEKAKTLAEEANAGPQLFQATWGLYLNAGRNQRLDKAKVRGEELLTISEEIGDEDLKFEALHHRWGGFFHGPNREDTGVHGGRHQSLRSRSPS
jgi:predicted ATPase